MHHPGLTHSKSTSQLDVMMMHSGGQKVGCVLSLPPDENGNQQQAQQQRNKSVSKFGLLIRTPRRRRANCLNQQTPDESSGTSAVNRLRSKSWDHQSAGMNVTNNPGKSTWSGWRSLRKISDTLIDYALNEPYKADSVFDDGLLATSCKDPNSHQANGIYRRRSEHVVNGDVAPSSVSSSVRGLLGSKTVGHAQGVSNPNPTSQTLNRNPVSPLSIRGKKGKIFRDISSFTLLRNLHFSGIVKSSLPLGPPPPEEDF